MDENEIFLNILRENMLYLRHQETQRMWTANIFIAIVVGTLVYSIHMGLEQIPWFIPFAFLIISTLCFLITVKLSQVFAKTQKSIEHIFKENKIPEVQNKRGWRYYMTGLKSENWVWKTLRIRHLYLVLYASAITGAGYWLFKLDWPGAWIAVLIVGLIVVPVTTFAIYEWCKKDEKGQDNTKPDKRGKENGSKKEDKEK